MWSLDKHNSLSPFCPPQFLLTAEEKESSWLSHEQTVNEVTFDALCQPNSSLSSRPPQQSTHKITHRRTVFGLIFPYVSFFCGGPLLGAAHSPLVPLLSISVHHT